jgi:4a-hydroxytetrahydrobiopterin dehydratase
MAALLKRSAPYFLDIHFSGLFENLYQLTMRHTRAGWQSGQARLLRGGPMTERSKERTYTDAEIEARLKTELPHWYLENGWIRRKYRTNSWKGTLMVINTVGHLAEAAWHHPDITASYAWVEVRLQNHAAKGITDKDFELAKKIEEVVHWQPAKAGGALEGTPGGDQRFAYIKYDG